MYTTNHNNCDGGGGDDDKKKKKYILKIEPRINITYVERGSSITPIDFDYMAGPIKISVCGWSEKISISTTKRWEYLLEDIIPIITEAWCISKNDIMTKTNPITIKTNHKIIC